MRFFFDNGDFIDESVNRLIGESFRRLVIEAILFGH